MVITLAVPFIIAVSLMWTHTGEELADTNSERQGVTYLRPLVRLLAAAADQQSLDVTGTPSNGGALSAAIQDVTKVDAALGEALGVHDRWADVQQQLNELIGSPPAASSAYRSFGQVIDLIVALIEAVGDRSTLVLDPDLDSYYLKDVTVTRLPAILVSSGRLVDRASVASAASAAAVTRAVEVAVFADQIRQQSAILDVSMRKSFAATRTSTVTGALVSALDKFGDAVTSLAPPTAGFGGITGDAGRLRADRGRVRDTALVLEEVALAQLDVLLQARADEYTGQRRLTGGAVTVALVGLVGWLLLRRRPGRRDRTDGGRWMRSFGASDPAGAGSAIRGER